MMILISSSFLSDPVPYNIMNTCIETYLNKILFEPMGLVVSEGCRLKILTDGRMDR